MNRLFYFLMMAFAFSSIDARTLVFENESHMPVPDVRCIEYSTGMDSIASCMSDKAGVALISNREAAYVLASHPDYSDRLVKLSDEVSDTIILTKSVNLQEVTVTPSDMEEFPTHTTYRISTAGLNRYPTVLQALNEIPNLTVLANGSVFFEGNQNIKLLIDGVEATRQEVQALSKEDIAKVNVYQTPPLRFIAQGVASVIDIRLKSKLHGGNVSLDVTQAFQSLKGDNSLAMYYNYRQSRFSVIYGNENRHFRKYRQSESLAYSFDGVDYLKEKEGLDSRTDHDLNSLDLSYQVNKPDNFLYNVQAGGAINRNGHDLMQNVRSDGAEFTASNYLHTGFTRYLVGNYIEKKLGSHGTLLGNVNFQHHSTTYESRYRETGGGSPVLEDSHSRYATGMDAVLSEIQYQFPASKAGYFSLSAFETYHHSRYKDTESPFYMETNVTGALAQWIGWKNKVQWFAMMGVNWYRTSSTQLGNAVNLVMPSPRVNVSWRPVRALQLSADYSYTGAVPSIAQLSETDQWLDTRLVYHGNSLLKPYRTHSAGIRMVYNQRYINLSLRGSFSSAPGMICDMYTAAGSYMLQTLVNLDSYRVWSSQADITIKPLGDNRLTFWNRIIAADVSGRNREYSWDGYRFQWMSNLALNLDRWTAELFYQYPGKIVEGQLERPRAQCWSATLLFRPVTNLSVGVEWFMPFGKGLKESEHTVNSAPVHADTESFARDRANMLSLKVAYNFSFGRNRNSAGRQYDNVSNDSGILFK